MTSKYWHPVPPSLVTANSTRLGELILADTVGFRVGMLALVQAATLPSIMLEVKGVFSKNNIELGPNDGNFKTRTNVSAYTLALGANLSAPVQPATSTPIPDQENLSFEELPIRARRVFQVDPYGNPYTLTNPIPVELSNGTIDIGDVSIFYGNNELVVNADGSINVNVVETPIAGQIERSIFNEVTGVANGIQTQIVFYTVPALKTAVLHRIVSSGDNFARFDVYLNGVLFDTQRTWFGSFNSSFEYTTGTNSGIVLNAADTIAIKVLHTRPFLGVFDARIQVLEIT